MIRILAIDPGTTQSGWVIVSGERVFRSGTSDNYTVLGMLANPELQDCRCAIERFEARGMAIGDESIETVLWTGRFIQAWQGQHPLALVRRSAVKLNLCGSARAKDPNIRQALIDRLGAPGTRKAPGPTGGVKGHEWAALGVAVTAMDQLAKAEAKGADDVELAGR